MARKQLALVAAMGIANMLITLTPVKSGKNDIGFTVAVAGEVASAPTGVIEIADEAGKVRRFKDADDFVKQAGAMGMLSAAFSLDVLDVTLLQPKPFTGDIVKKNEALVTAYTKRKGDAADRSVGLAKDLALMAGDPSVPEALIVEKTAQKAAIDGLVVWLTSEITRINAILHPIV